MWQHVDKSSLRLLSDDNSGRRMMSNFSLGQSLHLLFALLWVDLDERMRHDIKSLKLFSLRVQICLLSLVVSVFRVSQ